MKTLALSLAALFFTASLASADWVLVQKIDTDGKEDQITTKMKGDQARVDMGDKMTAFVSLDGMTVLIHGQKKMMKMGIAQIKAVVEMAGKGAGKEAPKPVATGQKEKIGDWDTEMYTWEGSLAQGKFWVAKNFPKYAEINALNDKLGKIMGGAMAGMAPQAKDFEGMPVKSIMTVMGKTVTSTLVSAKEGDLPASEFAVPEGYSEMKIPGAP
ncbi:DUF4412 domain-containing protein [Prosthecobacter sp.]|uniref:DUF4412 domain-containing protein n=1 Tax=Prosthecobacter sp. TaxID=1965333 RepID=UPI003784B048